MDVGAEVSAGCRVKSVSTGWQAGHSLPLENTEQELLQKSVRTGTNTEQLRKVRTQETAQTLKGLDGVTPDLCWQQGNPVLKSYKDGHGSRCHFQQELDDFILS